MNKAPVVDASIIVAGLVEDETSSEADALLGEITKAGALVPSLFWYELRSVLLILERKGRLRQGEEPEQHLLDVRALRIETATGVADSGVLDLARRHGLTAYDAVYAALAVREKRPLATLDKALVRAGEGGAFDLWSFTSAPPT